LGADGCSKDTDCKGDRVCDQGVCVNPTYTPGTQREGLLPPIQPNVERPVFEPGWAAFEFAVGALVSAGVTVLPYFMLFANGQFGDQTLSNAIFLTTFFGASLASGGLQLAVSNGSRFYRAYSVGPFAAGILGMGAVLGLYYLTGWLPTGQVASGGVPRGGSAALLFVGAIVVVPLLQTAAINIFKVPREPRLSLGDPVKRQGIAFSLPAIGPLVTPGQQGVLGAQVALNGNF
jgi:hypothetical protein